MVNTPVMFFKGVIIASATACSIVGLLLLNEFRSNPLCNIGSHHSGGMNTVSSLGYFVGTIVVLALSLAFFRHPIGGAGLGLTLFLVTFGSTTVTCHGFSTSPEDHYKQLSYYNEFK